MNEKNWKYPLETVGFLHQGQKSDILKSVEEQLQKRRDQSTFEFQKLSARCDSKTRVSENDIHNPSIHDQDLPIPTKEFGNYSSLLNFFDGSIKNKCVDMEMSMSSSMKAAIHLGPNCLTNLEIYKKEDELRRD